MTAQGMEQLNPAQRQAVTHGDGAVLVIAGAGTGKTMTLACRVAHLIEQGVAPQAILLLTFTRRAAAEMLARAGRLAGQSTAGKVWGGTFHAMANRLLRYYGRAIGLAPEFSVVDQADAADLMNLIRSDLELGRAKRRFPRKNTLLAIYSRSVNSHTKLGEVLEKQYPWCQDEIEGIRQVFEQYTQRKREHHILDYDDLLLYWSVLCDAPGVGETVADRFEHILVDEYQDTNLLQAEILQSMRRRRGNITVVGDDAQSIYSFRAATVRNILDFPQQFAGAAVIKLEQNYRSVSPILAASNAVMAEARERYTKDLYSHRHSEQKPTIITCLDEAEQCDQVCRGILEKLEEGIVLREQAVLFRAGHHSDQLEVELARRNIPFVKYGGLKFIEAAHIKDMLAVLRLIANPADELSWFRVLQLLEGIGPATAQKIIAALGVRAGAATSSPLRQLLDQPPPVPAAARAQFAAFRSAVADCLGGGAPGAPGAGRTLLSPASQVERVRRFYQPICDGLYDNATVRLRDLEQLELIAGRYKSAQQFITDLTLDPPTSTQDLAGPPLLDEDYLILSTIHSAKGCEWDVVNIIHAADGMIPSDMSTGNPDEIEEERRLLYVAMTRARNTLNIFFPLRYYRVGRGLTDQHSYAQLTRFIPATSAHLFERIGAPGVTAPGAPGNAEGTPGGDITAAPGTTESIDTMLKNLWDD